MLRARLLFEFSDVFVYKVGLSGDMVFAVRVISKDITERIRTRELITAIDKVLAYHGG